jgi:hypothetical protein
MRRDGIDALISLVNKRRIFRVSNNSPISPAVLELINSCTGDGNETFSSLIKEITVREIWPASSDMDQFISILPNSLDMTLTLRKKRLLVARILSQFQ